MEKKVIEVLLATAQKYDSEALLCFSCVDDIDGIMLAAVNLTEQPCLLLLIRRYVDAG
jgi:hypothetical protein